jgi:hypothetical protein
MTDELPSPDDREAADQAQRQLDETADAWRSGTRGTEVEQSADEVASGAERAAQQPDYGREGQ